MYNVLEKLRSRAELNAEDERIKSQGLVLILRELHDKLDALVFEAYGWPPTLTDENILERLVALNKQRAAEERAGNIRWLRPDHQIDKFGSDAERARLADERRAAKAQSALDLDGPAATAKKPKYPTGDELAETIAIVTALSAAPSALSIEDLCAAFDRGGQVKKRITATVQALSRLGHISSSDGGASYRLPRVG